MYSYGLLEPGCYYLVQEEFDSIIELVKELKEKKCFCKCAGCGEQESSEWL